MKRAWQLERRLFKGWSPAVLATVIRSLSSGLLRSQFSLRILTLVLSTPFRFFRVIPRARIAPFAFDIRNFIVRAHSELKSYQLRSSVAHRALQNHFSSARDHNSSSFHEKVLRGERAHDPSYRLLFFSLITLTIPFDHFCWFYTPTRLVTFCYN